MALGRIVLAVLAILVPLGFQAGLVGREDRLDRGHRRNNIRYTVLPLLLLLRHP